MSMVEWGGAGGGRAHPLSASGRAQHSIGEGAEEPPEEFGAVFLSFAGGPSEASVVLSPPPGGPGR